MSLPEICVKRPVFATMLTAALVVVGIFSFRALGVDLFPKVDFPNVTVTTTLRGAGPEEIESQISKPIEEAVNTLSGVDELRSVSVEGVSQVFVTFLLDKNIDIAAQEVRDRVAAILAKLPPGTDPPVIEKLDPDAAPIMSISLSSSQRGLREITDIADKQLKQRLETVNGIGQVLLSGGRKREIHINLDAKKLSAYGLTIDEIRQSLQRQNVEVPGGRVEQGKNQLVLRTLGRVDAARDFSNIIVASAKGSPIKVADLGLVEDTFEEPRTLSRLDGTPAVTLLIRKQSGTNTVEIVKLVKERLEEIRRALPADLSVQVIRDQSIFIENSVKAIEEHLVLGGLLTSLVVLLFMHNLRSTLIAAVAVPTSIIATFGLMRFMGFTLNNMTLLALTLAVGIVIDDAIVVLENIFRYVEELGYPPMEAAVEGTKEISLAVMATTFSLVVIFLPVAFMGGLPGRFLYYFGVTMAFAILVSLLVSFTLTPMLSSRFLKVKQGKKQGEAEGKHLSKQTGFYAFLDRAYGRILSWSLGHRWAITLVGFLTFLSIFPIFGRIGKDFIPFDDQDEFSVVVKAPEGMSLTGTDAILQQMEGEVKKLRGVEHLLTSINSTGQQTVTDADIYVRLVPLDKRAFSQFDVMKDARRVLTQFPGIRVSVQNVAAISGGGRRNTPVEFNLRGPDLDQLGALSRRVMVEMNKIQGLVDVDTTLNLGNPELRVKIDREKAADLGVRVSDIAEALRLMVSGEVDITKYKEGDDQYEVRLRVLEKDRNNAETIGQLMVPSSRLGQVRLENVATLERGVGPSQIDRYNRQRQVTLVSNLDPNKPLGDAVNEIKEVLRRVDLPPGYDFVFSGRAKLLAETALNFLLAFLLSLIFMYMILAAQFESFIHPVTILLSLPLTIPFALLSLFATHKTLNLWSTLGILLLFGVVKKNGILQIDYTNTLRAQGMERDRAVIEANHARLRPILMTTLSIIAGLIPTAMGTGAGSAQRSAIAVVIIGGQSLALLLTLLVTPVAYTFFDDLVRLRIGERLRTLNGRLAALPGKALKRLGLFGFFLLLVFSPNDLFAQQPQIDLQIDRSVERLTLKEAIETALRSHPSLQSARGNLLAREAQLGEVKANFYPTLDLSADYKRSTDNFAPTSRLGTLNQFSSRGSSNSSSNNYSAGLALKQRIFDFGKTRADAETARENIEGSRWDEEAARGNVSMNVKIAYFGLLQARRLVQVNEETVRQFEQHLQQTEGFFQVGTRPKFDVTKAEVDLTNAQLNLIKARNAAEVARAQLANAIGLPNRPIGEIEDLLGFEKFEVAEDKALAEALERRPELLSLRAKRRSGEAAIRSAQKGYFPVLSGTADYTYGGQEFPLVWNWDVGLNLTFPLFTGYLTKSQVAGARANVETARADEEALRQNIFLEVRQAYLNLLEAEERVRTSDLVVRQAEENLALANGRFQAGIGASVERTDAQVLLTNAKTSQTQALYDYKVAEARLEKAMGRL